MQDLKELVYRKVGTNQCTLYLGFVLGQNKITKYNNRILLTEMTERLINNNKNAYKLVSVKGKRRNRKRKKGMLQCTMGYTRQ